MQKPTARQRAPRESKRRGELVELAFLHMATAMGLKVSKPYGDSGRYDFIVDTGRRLFKVQVKSTSYAKSSQAYGASVGRNLHGRVVPYLRSQVDFIAIYVVPEQTWYILPMRAVVGQVTLRLPSKSNPKLGSFGKYRNAWTLLRGAQKEKE